MRAPAPRSGLADGAARGTLGVLVDRSFGPYLAARQLASIGVWVHNVVAAVVVFNLTGSAFMVGVVSIAMFVPQVLLAPLAGARADRGNHRRQLMVARLIVALGAGSLAIWIATVGLKGTAGGWVVIAAGLVVGIGFAVGGPAAHALLPALVRPAELGTAVALSQTPFTVARAVGPALGAGLLATLGSAAGFAFSALSNLVYGGVIARVRLRPVAQRTDIDRSVRAGLRHVRADPVCAVLLAGVTAIGFGVDPIITLTPSIADSLGGGEPLVGAMASAFGAGAAVTALASGGLRRRVSLAHLAPLGLTVFAGGLGALALAPAPGWAVAATALAGAGMILAITSLTTQLQARLPEHLRGRVMALWMVAFIGSRPLAAAINGGVADVASARLALVVGVAVLLAGARVVRPRAVARAAPAAEAA